MTDEPAREDLPGFGRMQPIIEAVTRAYKISETLMLHGGPGATPSEARRICAWLAFELKLRLSVPEIADVLGRHTQQIRRGIKTTERHRENDAGLRELTDKLLAELRGA